MMFHARRVGALTDNEMHETLCNPLNGVIQQFGLPPRANLFRRSGSLRDKALLAARSFSKSCQRSRFIQGV
jgi:hypothetical protein